MALNSHETDLRKWAVENALDGDLDHAWRLLAFVTGTDDATPRERIEAALREIEAK